MDGRTPVVVGAAAAQDHESDALELMWAALQASAADSGAAGLLRRVEVMAIPRGTWSMSDPGRLLEARAGASARTVVAEIGVLQQTLISRAATAIAEGRAEVVAIVGGEAKDGASTPRHATPDDAPPPDEVWRPEAEIISRLEIDRGLGVPARQYAMIDNALRWATGDTIEQQAATLGGLWAGMNGVAQANPDAWDRHPRTAPEIVTVGPGNRMIAAPYTKWLCSQWNVRQAAALVMCSAEVATDLRVPRDRWVFPVSSAESNAMIPVSRRADLARCPAFGLVATRALDRTRIRIDDVAFVDLYSCFPAAVRLQQQELGLHPERPVTVTGGMTFGGGPFNSYVLQSTAKMLSILREDPVAIGMVTTVSGMLTKQAVGLWAAHPPTTPFQSEDVSREALDATKVCDVVDDFAGSGTIASYTVAPGIDTSRAIALVDVAGGRRTIATSDDQDVVAALGEGEWCGRSVTVSGPVFQPEG